MPQQAANQGVGQHEIQREFKRRKLTPWLYGGSPPAQLVSKKAQDAGMSKLKVLDVKIIQQLYKRIEGAEILQQTRVFDGTGKIPQDEHNEEIAQLLYQD